MTLTFSLAKWLPAEAPKYQIALLLESRLRELQRIPEPRRYNDWREVYHCIRLLGPDEWHENVDDNAFTNYQVRAALDFAVSTYQLLAEQYPAELAALRETLGLAAEEVDRWRRVRDRIFLPQPHPETGLIEQFNKRYEELALMADPTLVCKMEEPVESE